MNKWLMGSIVAALLLAVAGALHQFARVLPGIGMAYQEREHSSAPAGDFRLAQRRSAIEECRQAAWMVYDVHWAAACATQVGQNSPGHADGHAECDLPNEKAAVVNAWLDKAEKQCEAEVQAGLRR